MKRALVLTALSMVTLAGGVVGAGGAGTGSNDCGDGPGGHQLTWSPTTIWPPNHKYIDVTITYTDDDPDHTLSLAAVAGSHDELTPTGELNGAGNTADDVVLPAQGAMGKESVSVVVRVRSERSGRGDGRVYTIEYMATSTDENGSMDNDCSGQATVTVPHDCRGGACRGIPRP